MIDLTSLSVGVALGKGGQGKVFLATHSSGSLLAVKVVRATPELDRASFDLRATAFAVDPLQVWPFQPLLAFGLVDDLPASVRRQLKSAGVPKGTLYFVTAFVEGASLAALLAPTDPPWTLLQATAVLEGLANLLLKFPLALAHGDLQAANILVRPNGTLALIDPDLFHGATPVDDLHALGRLGREILLRVQVPPADQTAQERLHGLCERLAGQNPPSPAETLRQLAEVGVSLPGTLATALVPRVQAALAVRPSPVPPPKPEAVAAGGPSVPFRWVWRIAAGVAAVMAIIGSYGWHFYWAHTERHVTLDSEWKEKESPFIFAPMQQPDTFFAPRSEVGYSEPIHLLGPTEKIAEGSGLIALFIETNDVASVSIVDQRADHPRVFWTVDRPPEWATYYFSGQPGLYAVIVDRSPTTGVAPVPRPFKLTIEHPFKYGVSSDALNAPHPGGPIPGYDIPPFWRKGNPKVP